MFLKISQNSKENTCACNFIKKKTLAQLFSCEFCEMFKNTLFAEHLWTTFSGCSNFKNCYPCKDGNEEKSKVLEHPVLFRK